MPTPIAVVAVTVVCRTVTGGWALEHRGDGSSAGGSVPARAQELPVWQLGPMGVTSEDGRDVFDNSVAGPGGVLTLHH